MGLYNAFISGVWYDVKNQAHAEKELQFFQGKLSRDAGRGHLAAADRDVHCIENLKFRIAADEWLIRKNSLQHIGYYPIRRVELSCAAIAEAARPAEVPYIPSYFLSSPAPTSRPMATPMNTITVTIINAESAGAGLAYAINDVPHQAVGGSSEDLTVAPNSYITYDSGGSLGQRRYRISPGRYEFRSTTEGWALYKLPGMP